jgi:tRNA-dihydrouridine synthase
LLKDSEVFSQFVSKLSTKLGPHHLSIKMRTGYHDSHDFLTLIKSMEHLALKHLTIHGRTKAERYLGKANWQAISEAANVLSFPVIGSGDICDLETFANRIPHHSKISGVIIGRGALRNPWVFTEILTGQKVSISLSTLHWSLSSYALICHMFRYDFDRLIDLVLSGAFKHCLGTSSDKWQTFYQTLSQHLFGGTVAPEDLELSVPTLGRIKMLWHYLRSSLPEPFFRPTCLRSKSLGEFLNHLGKAGLDAERCDFTLCWYPEKDWVYAGKGAAS